MSRPRFGAAVSVTVAAAALTAAGCTDDLDVADVTDVEQSIHAAPVGLAVEVDNGNGIALQLKRGQTYYLNQIDLRASITATTDEGVAGLRTQGDFKNLP